MSTPCYFCARLKGHERECPNTEGVNREKGAFGAPSVDRPKPYERVQAEPATPGNKRPEIRYDDVDNYVRRCPVCHRLPSILLDDAQRGHEHGCDLSAFPGWGIVQIDGVTCYLPGLRKDFK